MITKAKQGDGRPYMSPQAKVPADPGTLGNIQTSVYAIAVYVEGEWNAIDTVTSDYKLLDPEGSALKKAKKIAESRILEILVGKFWLTRLYYSLLKAIGYDVVNGSGAIILTTDFPKNSFIGRKVVQAITYAYPKIGVRVQVRHMFSDNTDENLHIIRSLNGSLIMVGELCLRINNGLLDPMEVIENNSIPADIRAKIIGMGKCPRPDRTTIKRILKMKEFSEDDSNLSMIKYGWKIVDKEIPSD